MKQSTSAKSASPTNSVAFPKTAKKPVTTLASGFDYEALEDKEARAFLRKQAASGKMILKRTAQNIWDMGEILNGAKSRLRGQFESWVKAEFDLSPDTALNFMNVFERIENPKNSGITVSPTVLYMIAGPSVSAEARDAVLEKSAAGEKVTTAEARAIIQEVKPHQENPAPVSEVEPAASNDDDFDDSDPFDAVAEVSDAPAEKAEVVTAAPAPPPPPPPAMPSRAVIVHDTLTPAVEAKKKAPKEAPMPDNEWLETLPVYRVLKTRQHKGIFARRALLDWRRLEKAISIFSKGVASAESVKGMDKNPFAVALSAPRSIRPPELWGICAPCFGGGCERCGGAGFDMLGGNDPARIESGDLKRGEVVS